MDQKSQREAFDLRYTGSSQPTWTNNSAKGNANDQSTNSSSPADEHSRMSSPEYVYQNNRGVRQEHMHMLIGQHVPIVPRRVSRSEPTWSDTRSVHGYPIDNSDLNRLGRTQQSAPFIPVQQRTQANSNAGSYGPVRTTSQQPDLVNSSMANTYGQHLHGASNNATNMFSQLPRVEQSPLTPDNLHRLSMAQEQRNTMPHNDRTDQWRGCPDASWSVHNRRCR